LGMRSTWFDKRLTLNGAVNHINWRDLRVSGTSHFGQGFLTNGSRALSQGLELQFQARLPGRLELLGTYSYDLAKMTAPAPRLIRTFSGSVDAQNGDRLPDTPQHTGALHIRRSWTLPGDYEFSANYAITGHSNIYSKIGNRANGQKLPGYALQDIS